MIDKLVPREFKSDQDERLTPSTVYIDGLNISIDTDEDGNAGVVKTAKGTNPIPLDQISYSQDSETVQVIGSCRDDERGRTYFFVYCSTASKNAIFYYDDVNNGTVLVTDGSYLNFAKESKISCDVVNGEFRRDGEINSLLYFTDDRNEPRKINVDHADELEGLSDTRLELYTSVLKQSPHTAPSVSFGYNSALGVGTISDKSAYQFAYQYIYKDGEVSGLSPTSVSFVPQKDSDGRFPNHAVLTFYHLMYGKGSINPQAFLNPEVSKIRVLYKEESNLEISPFRILDEYDPSEGIVRNVGSTQDYIIAPENGNTYVFLDRGYKSVLPSVQEDNATSAVPRVAKAQAVNNSRLFYGNYVEGFNNLGEADGIGGDSGEASDVSISVNYSNASAALNEEVALIPTEGTHSTGNNLVAEDIDFSGFPEQYNNGDTFEISITSGVRAIFNDEEILENVRARLEPLVARATVTNFQSVQTIEVPIVHEFSVGGQEGFQVCSVSNPIQLSIPITGNYDKAGVIEFINSIVDDSPIVRYEDITLTNDNITQVGGYKTIDYVNLTGGPLYQPFQSIPDPDVSFDFLDTDYWSAFRTQVENFLSDPGATDHPFHGGKIRVQYDVRLKFFYDEGSDTISFRLNPTNPRLVQHPNTGLISTYPSGDGDGWLGGSEFSSTGGNIVQYNIQNTDQDETVMSIGVDASIPGFSAGSNHSFAFAYYDNKGRISSAQEIGSVYVEPIGGPARVQNGEYKNGPATITFTPNHEPPDWASGYRLLYAGPDDIKDSVDLYVDYPTKVIKETKFFKGIPSTVFVKISGFVENLRKDGIEFNQIYNVEEGDIFRIISRRKFSANGSYVAGDGAGNGIENPHEVLDEIKFYNQMNNDAGTPDAGTLDFEVVGITEISANTSLDDYPFLLNPDGTVDGGIFLELRVPSNEIGWGKDRVLSVGEFTGAISNPFQDADGTGISRPNYAAHIENDLLDSGDTNNYIGDTAAEYFNFRAYREQYKDNSLNDAVAGQSKRKYLHNTSCWWDKGVRAQLVKPKKRTAAKVYHEIGELRTFVARGEDDGPHGPAFETNKGFARFRTEFSSNVEEFGGNQIRTELLPGADGAGDGFRFLSGNPFSVRPFIDTFNFIVESQRCSIGSLVKANHIGRLNVATPDIFEERRQSSIIHSGFQGSETLTLALHDFGALNFKDMDVRYGSVNALVAAGQYLNSFQSSKVSRIPINRSILATAGGDNNLTASNTVMGPEMSFEGDYGLDTDVSGVLKVDGSLYFIDKGRRSILKISKDGFLPISDVDISRQIEKTFVAAEGTTENYTIGYDKESNEVLFTFIPFTGFDGETYAYDHKKSKWVTRYGFTPSAYIEGKYDVLSSRWPSGSLINSHDNVDERGKFYGTTESAKISCISTSKNPSKVKLYNAVGIESNAAASIKISNTDQSVDLPISRFKEKERSYYASIPFDGSHLPKIHSAGPLDLFNGTVTTEQDELGTERAVVRPVGVINTASNSNSRLAFDVSFFSEPVAPESGDIIVIYYGGRWMPAFTPYLASTNNLNTDLILFYSAGFLNGTEINTNLTVGAYINGYLNYGATEALSALWSSPNLPYSGAQIGYAKVNVGAFGDSASPHTTVETQITVGGKKIRDHYARLDLTSAADGKSFELYSINVDADDSKYHM